MTLDEDGAWGDNVVMQAIADMLSVTVNVVSRDFPVYSVIPPNHCSTKELFVGLIMQYHYVGLDIIAEPAPPMLVLSEQPGNELDDAIISEGDEYRVQISGASKASMMCVENPESFTHTMCVAPAEREKPTL